MHRGASKFSGWMILTPRWHDIVDTPLKKYDLISSINSRGSFAITQACMPHMLAAGFGRVITMSPPIVTDMRAFAGKTAYFMSKFGMTMVALGAAADPNL